jgi:hypothetical protein
MANDTINQSYGGGGGVTVMPTAQHLKNTAPAKPKLRQVRWILS